MNTRQQSTRLILHYFNDTPHPDGSLVTLCGQSITPIATGEACDTLDAIECPLCMAAWELKDIPIPQPEQGQLW